MWTHGIAQIPEPSLTQVWPPILQLGFTNQLTLEGSDLDDLSTRVMIGDRIGSVPGTNTLTQYIFIPKEYRTGFVDIYASNRWGFSNPRRLLLTSNDVVSLHPAPPTNPPIPLQASVWYSILPQPGQPVRFLVPPSINPFRWQVLAGSIDSKALPLLSTRITGKGPWRHAGEQAVEMPRFDHSPQLFSLNDQLHRGGSGMGLGFLMEPSSTNRGPDNLLPQEIGDPTLARWFEPRTSAGWQHSDASQIFPKRTLPLEVRCEFSDSNEGVGFDFEAKAGESWWVELVSDRVGFPTDAYVWIQRKHPARGTFEDLTEIPEPEIPAQGPWKWSTRDCSGRLEIKDPGEYRLVVRNAFRRAKTRNPFWLRIAQPRPDLDPRMWISSGSPADPNDQRVHRGHSIFRAGETRAIQVSVTRREGFTNAFELTVPNIGPGWRTWSTRIEPEQNRAWILVRCDGRGLGALPAVLEPSILIPGTTRRVPVTPWTILNAVTDINLEAMPRRPADRMPLSVVDERAVLEWVPAVPAHPRTGTNGLLKLDWNILYGAGSGTFERCRLVGHPALEKFPELSVPANATHFACEVKLADYRLPPGSHLLWIHGRLKGKYSRDASRVAVAERELKTLADHLQKAGKTNQVSLENMQKEAAAKLKAAQDVATPRDVNLPFWSEPILVDVAER